MKKIEFDNKDNEVINDLYNRIAEIVNNSRYKAAYQVNNILVDTYFLIGKLIVENEQNGKIRAEYGRVILLKLSKKLTNKFGSGFSRSFLQNMRLFYNKYRKCQPLAGKLSWSHYCYLIYIDDDYERSFYEQECINSNWSKRELKRQIDSGLFQRILLSNDIKKNKIYDLAINGNSITSPEDMLRDPYVFELLIKKLKMIVIMIV